MEYKPHDYQTYVKDFIINHLACGVFLDMGLGKTVITLTALWELVFDYFEVEKILIIAPLRVAKDTWPKELEKWSHLQGLTSSVVIGTEKERKAALASKAYIYLINRENIDWLVHYYEWDFDMVVIDELSSFKSYKTKRFKALKKVKHEVNRIVGLTGTPAPNGLMDLWAQVNLLDGGKRLGYSIQTYRDTYFEPEKWNKQVVFSYRLKKNAAPKIYTKLSDLCITMKAVDYLDMPACIYNITEVTLDEKTNMLYQELKNTSSVKIGDSLIAVKSDLGVLTKLQQLANGSIYDCDEKMIEVHDYKLDALEDMIEAANGKPLLIAYWFEQDKRRIQKRFGAVEIDTVESISKWNEGELQIAIIHPASVGHGINLQEGGSTLIWFGLTWSLELYQQTNARLWRQGQKHTVVINHLVAKNTLDIHIIEALERKVNVQEALVEAIKISKGAVALNN